MGNRINQFETSEFHDDLILQPPALGTYPRIFQVEVYVLRTPKL